MKKNVTTIMAMGTLLGCLFAIARAEEAKSRGEDYFTNTELVDQHGNKVRFYSDAVQGKVVVINAFYTTDTESIISKRLEVIQQRFGDRLGKDIFFVSITVDPANDPPERLQVYAKKFNAQPGWMFLTGKKENIQTVLKKLGLYENRYFLLIGNDSTGLWKKALGRAPGGELEGIIESVMNP